MAKLARSLSVRQQALATAQVYVRRFYTKVEIRRTNPLLVVATALYLACKMEECPQHIRLIFAEAGHAWPGMEICNFSAWKLLTKLADFAIRETSKIGECEFSLISEMNSQLIIHHPYRSLQELQSGSSSFPLTPEENSLAWSIINDHYLTDLPLLYPPHIIALTAMFLAVVLRPTQSSLQMHATNVANALQALGNSKSPNNQPTGAQSRAHKIVNWLSESDVDFNGMIDCTQELISLYEVWEQYNDKVCREQINRFVKGRGLDK
jgi:cyclin-C